MEAKSIEKKHQTDMKTLTDTHSKEMETALAKIEEFERKMNDLENELDQERAKQ